MENVRKPCQAQKIDERRGGRGGGKGGGAEGRGEGYCDKKMLTSHGNCLEATGHNVEVHGMWHLLLLNDCSIGELEKRQIMHCSTGCFKQNARIVKWL